MSDLVKTFKLTINDPKYGTDIKMFEIPMREQGYTWDELKEVIEEIQKDTGNPVTLTKPARYKSVDRKDNYQLVPDTDIPAKDAYIMLTDEKMASGGLTYKEARNIILGSNTSYNVFGKTKEQLVKKAEEILAETEEDDSQVEDYGKLEKSIDLTSRNIVSLEPAGNKLAASLENYLKSLAYKLDMIERATKEKNQLIEDQIKYYEELSQEATKKAEELKAKLVEPSIKELRQAKEVFNSMR